MINANDFESLFVRPSLSLLAEFDSRMASENAVKLLMGTAAQESHLGFWMGQMGAGPGLGPFSVEPATNRSLWRHYLSKPSKAPLKAIILAMVPESAIISTVDGTFEYVYVDEAQLTTNMLYSVAMARVVYWPKKEALPTSEEIIDFGRYWDIHFNGNPYKGTPEEFVANYKRFLKNWRGL